MPTVPTAEKLDDVSADFWRALLERNPTWATSLSVHDHDDRLDDLSPEGKEQWRATLSALQARAAAVPEERTDGRTEATLAMLRHELETNLAACDLGMENWTVDQLVGPQVSLLDLVRAHRVHDSRSATTFLARVRAMPELLRQHEANLAQGLADGLAAPRCTVVRALQQLEDLHAAGPATCSLATFTASKPAEVPEAEWTVFRRDLLDSLDAGLFPAFGRYRDFLRERVLPVARETPGLSALPGGDATYRTLIRLHVTVEHSPEELHATGMREMERIREGMTELTGQLFPGTSHAEALRRLREEPEHSFSSAEEIVAKATSAVRRATEAAHRCFSLLPDHPCVVKPIDPHAEKSAPAAFYMGPAPDGSRPGTYFVNTWKPQARPRHEAEVVAFHEAVPGHHLQVAVAQKLEGLPEFQKHVHSTSFVEGWALYTERLADELGLYTGPLDRLGMFSCDAWRASRLVVDTGLHALGWSRQQAIAYMAENTAASMTDIENEVDRYIAWPGQALAYKTGQLEILALRRAAEAALGGRFDLADFHRAVLENGGVPLPVLRRHVERWIESERG